MIFMSMYMLTLLEIRNSIELLQKPQTLEKEKRLKDYIIKHCKILNNLGIVVDPNDIKL